MKKIIGTARIYIGENKGTYVTYLDTSTNTTEEIKMSDDPNASIDDDAGSKSS